MEHPERNPRSLSQGSRLGPYTIGDLLGSGGMGEVYRARDAKLARDVAVKVVRPALLGDPSRVARFEREARLLASLQHPHIAAVYGFEESDGVSALVMELVEGPTLFERILAGPLPVDEALPIALQIAEALEAAHERGIVHRDLKPLNIKLATGDHVKVLDFGLAKALDFDASTPEGALSPTLTAATAFGLVLGTPAYMSPEQAQGKPVDRRTDVWAFGCVLFEMLTGARTFGGETVTETMAAILRGEPEWSSLPASAPPRLRELVRRCLEKDPRRRLQAVGDGRILLEELAAGSAPVETSPDGRRRVSGSRLALAVAAVLSAAVAGIAAWTLKPSHLPSSSVVRFTIRLPPGQRLATGQPALALSADGSRLAYVASEKGREPQIYLRALAELEAVAIPGTEGASYPFFSPDGEWLGFFAEGALKKIPVRGGDAQVLAPVTSALGGVWAPGHRILYAGYLTGIGEVPEGGGAREESSRLESADEYHAWPDLLPDGETLLFGVISKGSSSVVARKRNGVRHALIEGHRAYWAKFLSPGYLLYGQGTDLVAAPFDSAALAVRGAPVRVVKGFLQFAVSASGELAYLEGDRASSAGRLVWVGRDGKIERVLGAPPRNYYQPRVDPHGERVTADVRGTTLEVWLYDPGHDTMAPFTFGGLNRHAIWTPDGKRITFMSDGGIFWQAADGSGARDRLTQVPVDADPGTLDIPYSWSPDGRQLGFVRFSPVERSTFLVATLDGDALEAGKLPAAEPVFQVEVADGGTQLSPDGRWLAYAGLDERGHRQIFVRAYPGPGGIHQLSVDGGNEPQWNPNGRELFFRSGDSLMAVDIATGPSFSQGKPHELFEGPYFKVSPSYARANYDVSADGQRFLMVAPVTEPAPLTEIRVLLNAPEELRRLTSRHD